MFTLAMVAGEPSGDLLGASLIKALRLQLPELRIIGIGGPLMQEQGLEPLADMEQLSIMGLVEVLSALPKLLALRRRVRQQILDAKASVFVGIDAPDFNLGLARSLKPSLHCIHYVSPTVWAWRPKRVFKIERSVHQILCLFPFEPHYYQDLQLEAHYIGHPLADEIAIEPRQRQARQELELAMDGKYLAILPGSRSGEAQRLMPVLIPLMQAWHQQHPEWQFLLPAANGRRYEQLYAALQGLNLPVKLYHRQARLVMQAANLGVIASGTASLEAMLCHLPMVIVYRVHPLSWWLGSRLLKIANVGLPNILAGSTLVPERLQADCQMDIILQDLNQWLDDPERLLHVREQYAFIHRRLSRQAAQRAAEVVINALHHSSSAR